MTNNQQQRASDRPSVEETFVQTDRGTFLYDAMSGAIVLHFRGERGTHNQLVSKSVTINPGPGQAETLLHHIKLANAGNLPAPREVTINPRSNRELIEEALAGGFKVKRGPQPARRGAPLTKRQQTEVDAQTMTELMDLI